MRPGNTCFASDLGPHGCSQMFKDYSDYYKDVKQSLLGVRYQFSENNLLKFYRKFA